MTRKKILFYTDTPLFGGAERQMILLAEYLDKKRFSVSFAYGDYSKMKDIINSNKFNIKSVHKHDPRNYIYLKNILKHNHFDLIHIHLWNPGACRYAFFAAKYARIPIITTEHDPFALRGLKKAIKKKCLSLTSHTIAISNANKNFLAKYYNIPKQKITAIYNGIEIKKFGSKKLVVSSKKNKIISCVAELHERKGIKYLIMAVKKCKLKNIKCIIIGKGPENKKLRKLVKKLKLENKIKFLGRVKNIRKIYKQSDIFVLPSLKEAFGLVLVEAMASGVPVISTNAGGVPEIIKDKYSGILIPPKNSQALTKAIEEILSSNKLRKKIIINAKDIAQKKFSVKYMAKNYEKIYKKCLI